MAPTAASAVAASSVRALCIATSSGSVAIVTGLPESEAAPGVPAPTLEDVRSDERSPVDDTDGPPPPNEPDPGTAEGLGAGTDVGAGDGAGEGRGVGAGDGLGAGEGLGSGDGLGDGLGSGLGEGLGVGDGVSFGGLDGLSS